MITGFVMVMMLIIEYINVRSKGNWSKPLQKNRWLQLLIAGILGVIPGCLGTYTIVSMYTHNIVGFGALVTGMIATSGDEAFVMLGLIPDTAILLIIIIFIIAIVTGIIVSLFSSKKNIAANTKEHFEIHEHKDACRCYNSKDIVNHFKNITPYRAVLLFGLLLFILGIFTGELGHKHNGELTNTATFEYQHNHTYDENTKHDSHKKEWDWISITFVVVSITALFIIATVPDHFLEHHLWAHIIKIHFLKILLWTFATLFVIEILKEYINVEQWVSTNHIYVLIAAVIVGIIPESGPHLLFVTMFYTGTIPFSVLLANSIVQDGHGALPLFAESKISFLKMKAINIIVGFIAGFAGYIFNF